MLDPFTEFYNHRCRSERTLRFATALLALAALGLYFFALGR